MRTLVLFACIACLAAVEAKRHNTMMWGSFTRHFNVEQREALERQRLVDPVGYTRTHAHGGLEEHWYDQRVDHFDPTNKETWKQLYYVNTKYYKKPASGKKAVAFMYFNGEGPLYPTAIDGNSYIMELAKRYNAFVVSHEHRYYGQSFPVKDLSVANMKYLSTEQALEDAAQFQVYINDKYRLGEINKDVTWVILGGSYSGFLSTAYRIRYPHLVGAAWSSSGVVLPKDNYPEFFEVVANDYTWVPGCTEAFANITSEAAKLWATPAGRSKLRDMFAICDRLTDADEADMWNLLAGPYASMAQYGQHTTLCSIVLNSSSPLDAYARVFRSFGARYDDFEDGDCNDIHWAEQEASANLTLPYAGARTWMWQTCTEFGWYQTFDNVNVFSKLVDLDYYHRACDTMFPGGFRPNTARVLYNYGGLKPEGSKIVSIAGIADPWHPVCQLDTYKADEPVYFITGHDASHCKDMGAPSSTDSAELKEARKVVMKFLDEWLDY